MTTPTLSIILPAYNEEDNIERALRDAVAAAAPLVDSYELVVVDDGSRDQTPDILSRLEQELGPCLKTVQHEVNRGYGAALRRGFSEARGRLIFYTDSDNQFDLTELRDFIPLMKEWDAILGYRMDRQDSFSRRFISNCFNFLASKVFGMSVRDVNCSFKLFRGDVIRSLELKSNNFFIDTELVVRLHLAGWRYLQKGVRHYPRPAGRSTVRPSDVPRTFLALVRIWLALNRRSGKVE